MKPFALNLSAALLVFTVPWSAPGANRAFNVRDHGAKGDGRANDRAALQSALDACAKAGGGTVRVPPGDYLSGALRMASGVTLHLEAGATLWASTNKSDYAGVSERHFLAAEGAQHLALAGRGVIHGQGTADYGARWGVPKKPEFRAGILLFTDCRDVTVRDVTILYSDAWTLHFKRCENVTVEDVTIRNNYRRLNSDGIDPNSCRRVRIARCRISAGVDCIVLKSTEAYPCEDVTVTDCFLESAASELKLGTESHGDFRDNRFANCVISNSPTGIGFCLKIGPGTFRCSGTITIPASGVVLRGSGSGTQAGPRTTIQMTGRPHLAIAVRTSGGRGRGNTPAAPDDGTGDRQELVPAETSIADAYVPSGAVSFTVADAAGLAVGDTIEIRRPVTPAWIKSMGMHDLVRDDRPQPGSAPGLASSRSAGLRRLRALRSPWTCRCPIPSMRNT